MRKYLLGACLAVSVQVNAYEGATVDFTSLAFSQAIMHGLIQKAQIQDDMAKQECVSDIVTPVMDDLAQEYVSHALTRADKKLMDDLFETPLGQNMMVQIQRHGLENFGDNMNFDQYHPADYEKYHAVMKKYFDEYRVTEVLKQDVVMESVVIAIVRCKLMDFDM